MIYVLFHANCFDGHGAAWAAKRYFDSKKLEATFIPMSYGDPIPEMGDRPDIFMLDFSFKRLLMEEVARMGKLTVIDHHKTAEADLKGFPNTIFDMKKSGAVLTWEYFFPDRPVPTLLQFVQDADLWRWKLPYSKEVNATIRSYPKSFPVWDRLAEVVGSA